MLLAPPIPNFKVQFDLTSPVEENSNPIDAATTTWPEEVEVNAAIEASEGINKQTDPKWILKTDREEYIAALGE